MEIPIIRVGIAIIGLMFILIAIQAFISAPFSLMPAGVTGIAPNFGEQQKQMAYLGYCAIESIGGIIMLGIGAGLNINEIEIAFKEAK